MSLEHFVATASRGKHPGASGGEKQAARLAEAILDNVPGLDGQAQEGAAELIRAAAAAPNTARRLLPMIGTGG